MHDFCGAIAVDNNEDCDGGWCNSIWIHEDALKTQKIQNLCCERGGIRVAYVSCFSAFGKGNKNQPRHFRWCFANGACEASLEDAVFFLDGNALLTQCLSPLSVRRGEGEFPLVGAHRMRWCCWVRCMVYPPLQLTYPLPQHFWRWVSLGLGDMFVP